MIAIPSQWNVLDNRILVVSFLAWFTAQLIKLFIHLFQQKRLDWGLLISSGNMPSAHSALVCALATSVGLSQGLGSALFAVTAALAMIVIYDAAGVRRTVGIQSTVLNRMLDALDDLFRANPVVKERLREFIGHTRMEVIAGVVLGIAAGIIGFWDQLAA